MKLIENRQVYRPHPEKILRGLTEKNLDRARIAIDDRWDTEYEGGDMFGIRPPGYYMIKLGSILYVKSIGGHNPLRIVTKDSYLWSSNMRSLKDFKTLLDGVSPKLWDRQFIQVNRSEVINITKVVRFNEGVKTGQWIATFKKRLGALDTRREGDPGSRSAPEVSISVREWPKVRRFVQNFSDIRYQG